MAEAPMVITEKAFLLPKGYVGYETHDVPVFSQHARVIACESVVQENGIFLLVTVLDRGFVSKVPEMSIRIGVYQRMGDVTSLGPAGELLGVVRVPREPHAYYVFLLRAPRLPHGKAPDDLDGHTYVSSPTPPAERSTVPDVPASSELPVVANTSAATPAEEDIW